MKNRTRKIIINIGWLLFFLYIVLLFYFLFFSEHFNRNETAADYQVNITLFNEIRRYINNWRVLGIKTVLINIPGNILAFMPFGFLLPTLSEKYRRSITMTFLSFVFSSFVELIQYKTRVGSFDVDDIFLNTLGGILGYLTYLISNRISNSLYNKRKAKKS